VCSLMLFSAVFVLINAQDVNRTDDDRGRIEGIAFYQVDYDHPVDPLKDSDTGIVELDVDALKKATGLKYGFVNGYTSAGWVIRNTPFFGEDSGIKKSTYFDLGSSGDVRTLNIYITVTERFLERMSAGNMVSYPVSRSVYYVASGDGSEDKPIFKPPDVSNIVFELANLTLTYWQPNHEPANNIESAVSQCVPAAYANSLGYLKDTFGITVPHDNKMGLGNYTGNWMVPNDAIVSHLDIMQRRYNVIDRLHGSGTGTNGAIVGILNYTSQHGLPIKIKHQGVRGDHTYEKGGINSTGMGDVYWPWVVNEVKYGKAVTIRYWRFSNGEHYGGHQVTIERAGWIGGVPYVEIVHDASQSNDAAGTVLQTSYLGINATDGNYTVLGVPQAVDGPVEIVRAVSMDPFNQAPATPSLPTGAVYLSAGNDFEYETSTTDPEGHDIYYVFDWHDGTYSDWVGPYGSGMTGSAEHSWDHGFYGVSAKARDQFYAYSGWSPTLHICVGFLELDDELDIIMTDDLPQAMTGEKRIDKELDKVIGHIRKSLEEDLWLDSYRLDPGMGHKVFSEHKTAIQKLQEILNKRDLPDETREICWEVAMKLALIDGQLAKTVIEEARQAGGGSGKQSARELAQAEDCFTKGLDEYVAGNPDGANSNYRQAWEHALKA